MAKISKVITDDGSVTFHNDSVDETYHSKSGALDEALRKHVIPTGIVEISKETSDVVIGDVCFGLGYNSLVAITEIKKVNPDCHIQIFAFENDYAILDEIPKLALDNSYSFAHDAISKLVSKDSLVEENGDFNIHVFSNDTLTITLYVGDVLTCLPRLADDTLDVVFFDPFSPQKNPHLWSVEFFSSVFNVLMPGGFLSTYSCARIVRDNLRSAGFSVKDGPSVGRRAPSTIAIKP
ncbi:hypothetical protein JXA48_01810 [Candidatus Woesearchaeota archaeon]|nr:hypothetical protein [Candidatus Woesearchaeota archaeon]